MKLNVTNDIRRSALLRDFFNNASMLAVLKTSIIEASQEMTTNYQRKTISS